MRAASGHHSALRGDCASCEANSQGPYKTTTVVPSEGARYRALMNEQEIETLLAEMNFETISLDDLTLDEQLAIFRDAVIIAPPVQHSLIWSGADLEPP